MATRQLWAHVVLGDQQDYSPSIWNLNEERLNPLPGKLKNVRMHRDMYPVIPEADETDIFFRGEFEEAKMPTMGQIRRRSRSLPDPVTPAVIGEESEKERHLRRVRRGRENLAFNGNGYYFIKPDKKINIKVPTKTS